jgi:hypothetical protein
VASAWLELVASSNKPAQITSGDKKKNCWLLEECLSCFICYGVWIKGENIRNVSHKRIYGVWIKGENIRNVSHKQIERAPPLTKSSELTTMTIIYLCLWMCSTSFVGV